MDPLTLSTTFATIVGLISNFKSERTQTSEDEYNEFISWLEERRYTSLIKELHDNYRLSLNIRELLRENHNQLLTKLDVINDGLLKIASQIEGFDRIAEVTNPNSGLSDQAISILKQLDNSGGSQILALPHSGVYVYMIMDGKNSQMIEITEDRFADDDFNQLSTYGFLNIGYNSTGKTTYKITRLAVKYLNSLK